MPTSHLKNTSNAQLRRFEPLQNAHTPMYAALFYMLHIDAYGVSRLVLERNPHF